MAYEIVVRPGSQLQKPRIQPSQIILMPRGSYKILPFKKRFLQMMLDRKYQRLSAKPLRRNVQEVIILPIQPEVKLLENKNGQ